MSRLRPIDFKDAAILLAGEVDHAMYDRFRAQLAAAPAEGLVVLELTTVGGDPEVARMIGEDIRFRTEVEPGRRFVFLGKAAVYSAGATVMSFFSRENRYLARGTRLMIHERKMDKELHVSGPLTCALATARALVHEIEHSIAIQTEGFESLIAGSQIELETLLRRAPSNWYIEATEAAELGLIEAVI